MHISFVHCQVLKTVRVPSFACRGCHQAHKTTKHLQNNQNDTNEKIVFHLHVPKEGCAAPCYTERLEPTCSPRFECCRHIVHLIDPMASSATPGAVSSGAGGGAGAGASRRSHKPVWKLAAFAGLFGDAFLSSTEVEGMQLASSLRGIGGALSVLAEAPGQIMTAPQPRAANPSPTSAESVEEVGLLEEVDVGTLRDTLAAAAKCLEQAGVVGALLTETPVDSGEAALAVMAKIRDTIASLARGKRFVLPVGWRTKKSGHFFFLVIDRAAGDASDTFNLVVCNAGPGLQYHKSSFKSYPKARFQTSLELPSIPRARFLDEGFLYMLLQAVLHPNDDNDAKLLYEVLLPHLSKAPLLDSHEQSPSLDAEATGSGAGESATTPPDGVDSEEGTFATPQRAGLCFVKSITAVVKFLLRDAGLTTRRVKAVMFELRMNFVRRALSELQGATINDSDRRLVKLACKQTAVAAVKLQRAGVLPLAALRDVQATLETVRSTLTQVTVSGQKFDYPAKLHMRMDAPLVPFPGFDLLHNTDSTEQYAGDKQDSAPSLFVDLLEHGPKETFEEVAAALQRAEAQCDRLRAKTAVSAASIAMHQIASLVEDLFTRVLPVPEPWSQELADGAEVRPWIPREVSLDTQRACLRALYRLGVQYVAAVKSVQCVLVAATLQSDRVVVAYTYALALTFVACVVLQVRPNAVWKANRDHCLHASVPRRPASPAGLASPFTVFCHAPCPRPAAGRGGDEAGRRSPCGCPGRVRGLEVWRLHRPQRGVCHHLRGVWHRQGRQPTMGV